MQREGEEESEERKGKGKGKQKGLLEELEAWGSFLLNRDVNLSWYG
jgi:hypothetical protein